MWADDNLKFSTKFKYYIHGKVVAEEIEKKITQPVDARRGELTRALNNLMGESEYSKSLFTCAIAHECHSFRFQKMSNCRARSFQNQKILPV